MAIKWCGADLSPAAWLPRRSDAITVIERRAVFLRVRHSTMASTTAEATEATVPEPDEAPFEVHEMRITNHGKINAWVDYALQFFEASAVYSRASTCVI